MPTYTESIRFEDETPKGTIRLIKSGEFYRAYNHSAWLFQCCIAEHKVMRKFIKVINQDIYYIGFPEKSLFSNIGERKSTKTDLGFDIELFQEEIPEEATYATWKKTIEVESSSKGDFYSLPLAGADAEREVIRRLKSFPIENKSLIDCAVFLAELRKLLNNQ
ncbi:MAG: hypothetical protein PHU62_05755 [Bacteroidales bacterium]|nr:hypothetical protein [Bacteroidales bacterium]MDD2205443.1 hypothetical protein [Bacteroidales bacterium]MDD3152703.1 hypothetical protein [Bacteroidales bacterium]MDD3914107.1 hypothetical protein [Bacteroidales bacterium]MDD4634059.1 hypothetical protein [Bacteroidales bacterium]